MIVCGSSNRERWKYLYLHAREQHQFISLRKGNNATHYDMPWRHKCVQESM